MNLLSLSQQLSTAGESIQYLMTRRILHISRKCASGHDMKLYLSEKEERWRCGRKGCRRQVQLKSGTWLEGAHLTYRVICLFIYCWAYEMTSVAFCTRELKMCPEAIVDWNNYLREVCALKLLACPMAIGGDGLTVEIDESMFVRRKGNVGRVVKEQWVFGGICRDTKQCFLCVVPDRSAAVLLPIIERYVLPKTTIISDSWRSYIGIADIPGKEYIHQTVNHSHHFVDPETGACTNTVESLWGRV